MLDFDDRFLLGLLSLGSQRSDDLAGTTRHWDGQLIDREEVNGRKPTSNGV